MLRVMFAIPGDLATPTGGYAYDRAVLARLPSLGVDVTHVSLPDGFPYPDAQALRTTAEALGALDERHTLLIDGLAYGALPWDVARAIRARLVVLVHHPLGLETGLDASTAQDFIAREKQNLNRADAVIVTSPATARLLRSATFGVPADRVSVAEPGTAKASRAAGSVSSTDSGRSGVPHLLAVGAVSRRKGYDVLIDALAMLASDDWRMTIVGADDRAPDIAADLRGRIAASGVGDRIRMLGNVDGATLAGLFASADIFAMPSLYEGYGMVLAEAMAHGLPIVCTTGGAAAETVPDAAGIKVPPGDAVAFAAAVGRLLASADLRRRLADASWAAGQRLPDWDDTTTAIADVLRRVATEGGAR